MAEAAADAADDGAAAARPRKRVGEGRLTGLVVEWKGHMGWIQPLSKVLHAQASWHRGLIYLNPKDVAEVDGAPGVVKEGKVVDFLVYEDEDGLGAEECRQRKVLRMTLPHKEARQMLKDSPQWSEYLTDSEHYPTFEREHGVLLRKYAWPLPFVLVELWGHGEALVEAALALAVQGGEGESERLLRLLVAEDDRPRVDSLPAGAKVSEQPVVTRPLPCYAVEAQASREECKEVVRAFLKALAAPAAGAAQA